MSNHDSRDADAVIHTVPSEDRPNPGREVSESSSSSLIFADSLRSSALDDPSVALLIDTNCTVLEQTDTAAALLCPPLPLSTRGGRLKANDRENSRLLGTFVEGLGARTKKLLLTSKDGQSWALIRGKVSRLAPHRLLFLNCILSLPLRSVASSGLAHDFGLTETEAAVLDRFARMESPREIAAVLHVSVSTVRSHLKQIHAKLNVHTNLQLLKLARDYCDN